MIVDERNPMDKLSPDQRIRVTAWWELGKIADQLTHADKDTDFVAIRHKLNEIRANLYVEGPHNTFTTPKDSSRYAMDALFREMDARYGSKSKT